ncbi:hypothetical protein WJX82_006015 [Trebouxia sp. C0006]
MCRQPIRQHLQADHNGTGPDGLVIFRSNFTNCPMSGRLTTAWQSICSRAGVPNYAPAALLKQTPPISGIWTPS